MCDKLNNISQEENLHFLENMNIRLIVTIIKIIYAFSVDQKKQQCIKDLELHFLRKS